MPQWGCPFNPFEFSSSELAGENGTVCRNFRALGTTIPQHLRSSRRLSCLECRWESISLVVSEISPKSCQLISSHLPQTSTSLGRSLDLYGSDAQASSIRERAVAGKLCYNSTFFSIYREEHDDRRRRSPSTFPWWESCWSRLRTHSCVLGRWVCDSSFGAIYQALLE